MMLLINMKWTVPKIWEGADVWIIGGGASIPKQFDVPKSIIEDVLNKRKSVEAYSQYMKSIHDKHVIGINVAYLLGDWLDMVFFGDSSFFLQHCKALSQLPYLKVSCHPKTDRESWVKYVARDTKKPRGISEHPGRVSWNNNSGSAAISIAVNAGAKRVILLGFDMQLEEGNQHWHKLYTTQNKKKFVYPFERHLLGFAEIAKDANKRGIEIINASPNSVIKEFRKVTVKELL